MTTFIVYINKSRPLASNKGTLIHNKEQRAGLYIYISVTSLLTVINTVRSKEQYKPHTPHFLHP